MANGGEMSMKEVEQMLADERFPGEDEQETAAGNGPNHENVVGIDLDDEVVDLAEGNGEERVVEEGQDLALAVTPSKGGSVDGTPLPPPQVGMVFSSMEAVDEYYRNYGVQEGFGVVKAASASYKGSDKNRKLRNALWTCDRYGKPKCKRKSAAKQLVTDSQCAEEESLKSSKKCECSAMIYASVNADNEWLLRKVVVEHKNHTPTPSKARHLLAVRKQQMNVQVKRKLMVGCAAGLKAAQIHNLLAKERNGLEELVLTERDVRNEMDREKRLKLEDGDAEAMLDYFDKMTEGNQNFYHTYRLDSTKQMQDILWVDTRSRAAYEEFGDVVVFDTTYLTNKYHLPFANFVGVNHHGQTILFGCALISRETTETFTWVFRKWLHCMNGRAPVGILTDQAAAMRRALANTMPETTHRWCVWHITSKFPEKLGKCTGYSDFKEELMRAIYDSMTAEEFELNWRGVIEQYSLGANEWLAGLFEEREMWIPAYTKHLFWAGMKTTQRVESIHSFFDDYVNPQTRLREFAESYCEAMEFRANSERELDAHTETTTLELQWGFAPEAVFQKCYTTMKFKEVQRECSRLGFLHCISEAALTEHETEYTFEDRVWCRNKHTKKDFLTQYRRNYRAVFDKRTNFVECECKLFNSSGIMCRHMVKLYDILRIYDVPEHYILRRWRKDIQRKHTRIKVAYHDPSKTEQVRDYDYLNVWFDRISSRAVTHKAVVRLVAELLEIMEIRVEEEVTKVENELLVQHTLTRTPSSVCNQKGTNPTTPASTTAAACKRKSAPASEAADLVDNDGEARPNRAHGVKDPPLPEAHLKRTAKRYQSVVEQAVNKMKKRADTQANINKATTRAASKQKKAKQTMEQDYSTCSLQHTRQQAPVLSTSNANQVIQGHCSSGVPSISDLQLPPPRPIVPAFRTQLPSLVTTAPPYFAPPPGPLPPYGRSNVGYFHHPPVGLALAAQPAVHHGIRSTQRVLFPPHSSDQMSSMHDSNSPATLDTNLKL